jgi:hypothetical protein
MFKVVPAFALAIAICVASDDPLAALEVPVVSRAHDNDNQLVVRVHASRLSKCRHSCIIGTTPEGAQAHWHTSGHCGRYRYCGMPAVRKSSVK